MSTEPQPPSIAPQRPPARDGGRPAGPAATGRTAVTTPPEAAPAPEARTATETRTAEPRTETRTPTEVRPEGRPAERTGVSERLAKAAAPGAGARGTATAAGGRPTEAEARTSAPAADLGPRRVRLAVARIDPWSVMKLSFLLSFAIGIMIVVAAAVVWFTLDGLHVFTQVNDVIATLAGRDDFFVVEDWVSLERVTSLAMMVAVIDIVLLTALSTIGAFLYNIVAALVGGLHLTLTDD